VWEWPGLSSYGLLLTLGWLAGWWWARRRAARQGLPTWCVDLLVPLLWLASGLGSRLAGWVQAAVIPQAVQQRTIYGSLVATLIVSWVFARIARISWRRLCDVCAPAVLLGIGLLRVGCLLGGCCWGDVCGETDQIAGIPDLSLQRQIQTIPPLCPANLPWRVTYPEGSRTYLQHRSAGLLSADDLRSLPVHPVQLYEAAAVWTLSILLLLIEPRLPASGCLFLLSVSGYAVMRFVVEWFRADQQLLPGGLTYNQYSSAILLCAGGIVLARVCRALKASESIHVSSSTPPQSAAMKSE
jgi:phosphatidylglycerol:prolipoprotein diacylglycerol transferase